MSAAAGVAGPLVRVGIRVRADAAELALANLLPLLAGGVEEREVDGDVEYGLYGPAGELPDAEEIRALAGDGLVSVSAEPVPEGWQRRWHGFLRPVELAGAHARLRVRAPWAAGTDRDLVVDPGDWFGAGSHPTTRLCLQLLLDRRPEGGLCDWGAGSGVLALAAARLGWAPVTAVEVEPRALATIAANSAANRVRVDARALDLRSVPAPWAATVTANLTGELHAAAAAALTDPPERLIASGMLAGQAGEVASAYARHGLREHERRTLGGWAALVLA